MNFHIWNDWRFSQTKNSRMQWLKDLHCFQSFRQFKILKCEGPQSRVQRPQSSVQSPKSRVQCPTLAFKVWEFRYVEKVLRVAQKSILYQQQKMFHIEVRLHTKITWATKKYFVGTKRIVWHPRERLMWTKHLSCCTEKEYMLTKNSSPST